MELDKEYALYDQIIIYNTTIEDVFKKCVSWFDKVGAKIIEINEPSYIKAVHFSNYVFDYSFIKKTIVVELKSNFVRIIIKFKILKLRRKTRRIYLDWIQILEDFYKYIDVYINNDVLRNMYSLKNINILIKSNIYHIIIMSIIALAFFYTTYDMYIRKINPFLGILATLCFAVLTLPFIDKYRFYKKKLKLLYQHVNDIHAQYSI